MRAIRLSKNVPASEPVAAPHGSTQTSKHDENGMTTIEAVIVMPLVLAMLLFVVLLGRIATAQQTIQQAARDTARAASIAVTRDNAELAIQESLSRNLGPLYQHCTIAPADLTAISTDTGLGGDFDSGLITIDLTCTIPTADLGFLAGANKTFRATAIEPVDVWRSRQVNS